MKMKVLIIDDENTICLSLSEGLKDLGYDVKTASNKSEGLLLTEDFKPHIVFLDMRLGSDNGLDILKRIKEIDVDIEVIIMTAYGNVETAVKAMRYGAFDYIKKPFDIEELQIILSRVTNSLSLRNKLYILEKENTNSDQLMIGSHQSMANIFNQIEILAKNDVTVLITGETGTGKELVAEAIHANSLRKEAAIVKINCGAIPKELVESELFGYEKNAFTGALTKKKGLFELADGGTVFLDEIGELPFEIQTKLLRFLEDRSFKRIGGLDDIRVDVRVIAATNVILEEAIKERKFREDLFYRLNVLSVKLPPLRSRGNDIIILANFFLNKYNKKFKKNIKGFSNEVKELFMLYKWPGNVRELKNVIERMVILYSGSCIQIDQVPTEIVKSSAENSELITDELAYDLGRGFCLENKIQNIERQYIERALNQSSGNHTKASKLLGISRFALKRRIEKYLIKPE